MFPITAHGTTFSGRRDVNQDDILHCYPSADSFFLAVADGMGGSIGGQIASQTVLQTAYNFLEERMQEPMDKHQLKSVLADLFDEAQQAIRHLTERDHSLNGMGTTLTCVLGYEDGFVVGNLGDSRVYHLSGGDMQQVTEDHSYLQEFKKQSGKEELDPDFVARYGHIINKTLDGKDDQPDFFPEDAPFFESTAEDGFLLCSDGLLVDKLQSQEWLFKSYMLGTPDLKTAAESLVSLAYYSGSTDNISIVLAEVGRLKRDLGRVRTYTFPPEQQARVAQG